jgi:hypothetical protein
MKIVKGKLARPVRVLIHGTEGVGKSTFAAGAPTPVFVCAEDGTAQLNVERFPEPRTFGDVLSAVDALSVEEHGYQTVVIDTLDWIEPLVHEHVCRVGKKDSIEDFGYGKGYVAALDQWRILVSRLDALRASRGMHVVLVAHSWIRPFADPEGASFDRYELKLHKSAAGLVKEWSDAVLFASYEQASVKDGQRTRGVSTGARIMRTERRAAFDAKNRFGLPFELPLAWSEFFERTLTPANDVAQLTEQATQLAAEVGQQQKTAAALKRANGDVAKLAQLVEWLKGKQFLTKEVA